ncbi:hypothetical protein ABEB36_000681 [Hypothenemus hampei]|uniref:Uncharacterized protein n=1 Tax=Hypothenemus hampei TaxID=57062 RepID=A0ABD1FEQ3_HYPHA
MKPITFENLRRLMGGGRKKKEKDGSSFKRSDSFKRISIRKSYLDRGKKKVIPKLEVATQTVSEEELLLPQIPEDMVKKVDSSVQVDKVDLNATIKSSGREIVCNKKSLTGDSVVVYSQWLQEIKREDPPPHRPIKGSERTIIYVPASDEKVQSTPVIRQLSSSPVFRKKNTSSTHICHSPSSNLQRKESNDSAVEMFPWGDSTEVKKSPLIRRRSRQSPTPLLPTDSGTEEMCSLSISLGRIWMDAPQAMAPRSLEMPKSSSSNPPPAHHSLDSALKDLRDDPMVSNRLQKRSTPPVTRTLSSTSNNTNSTGLFSSKDSGFSFSISAPKLSDFHANFSPNGASKGGFFRKKSRPKPKLSVSRDGYFKRTSSAILAETRRNSMRRSSKKKKNKSKKSKKKDKDSGTIRSDIYQVICSRPQRASISTLKLDPMIFVPPEKRKGGAQKPAFKTRMQEIRHFNPLDSTMYSTTPGSMESTDEGLYESLPGDYEYLTDEEEINLESFSMEKKDTEVFVTNDVSMEFYCRDKGGRNVDSGYGVVKKCISRSSEEIYGETTNLMKDHRLGDTRMYQKKNSDFSSCNSNSNYRSKCLGQSKLNRDHRYVYRDPSNDLADFSEEDSLVSVSGNSSDSGSDARPNNVYVPPGVSPVPRRRPVRRKKSNGLSHKRSITYLVKPTVIRVPSTLRRPAKKIGE